MNNAAACKFAPTPTFHIAFCVDNSYLRAMGAVVASIVANNPGQHFTFHILTFEVSEEHQARIKQIEEIWNVSTELHLLDITSFQQFSHFLSQSYYSLSIFTRLVIPEVLQGRADRVLYLDADILCVGKLTELIDLDISNEIAAVVADAPVTTKRRVDALKLARAEYFNGGVLFINTEKWIANDITVHTLDVLLNHKSDLRFNDQDALNIVLNGRAKYLDQKWNVLYGLIGDLENGVRHMKSLDDPRFIHFAGAVKPWHDWCLHESRDLFFKYHQMSPWSDMPLDQTPQNYKEMRMHSRFLLQRGKTLESIRWYLRYLKARPSKLPAFLR